MSRCSQSFADSWRHAAEDAHDGKTFKSVPSMQSALGTNDPNFYPTKASCVWAPDATAREAAGPSARFAETLEWMEYTEARDPVFQVLSFSFYLIFFFFLRTYVFLFFLEFFCVMQCLCADSTEDIVSQDATIR